MPRASQIRVACASGSTAGMPTSYASRHLQASRADSASLGVAAATSDPTNPRPRLIHRGPRSTRPDVEATTDLVRDRCQKMLWAEAINDSGLWLKQQTVA
jgi:hypothetical protein